ncbi:early estrogen-induced gene 1 protein-like isoform X1 [Biomphalaria glabrata]|uniref:Early estrogen-induced gene 1 protein-like isoform X1 n=1 Tax=Biomphalaria glabrata TaxID=6526 RepID=A0A9W3BH73_BIOGL|nr:early estrogen-induced gene 1 protein-like isoform X1 [Biomphalaria glabrata]XP_055898794.1 early estrogen-induced gene 1 protein-like isoform X1 [Biomphalaria glabrata]XP_055898795.1 early estrogen-induced gene 1 protein-like isoform X1 [Biomphalaria glabrata]XP_055898796.1 early estrogen-induced gene 1 protein-like isoform X1 [Biomphalaria glabrata]XP_055898797.1 early estrogen-induced gene 1 protein-like isoform X1 [Biomphalaria glabrata]XP_055898798.1 early estrogen-induced gene 1 prote
MIPFMSKKKKFKFQVQLGLEELASVPFVTGVLFAKVRLQEGGSFTDVSSREEVHNNCVQWKSKFEFPCKMTASLTNGVLDPCIVRISVRKELKGGRSHQKLGYVDLNLAHFAGGGKLSKRYLLEGYDTKHRQDNSNIKISVELSLISGDPVFKVPSNHSVSQSSSVTGHTDPIDLRPCDNHSEDSLASSSSGFSSLTRRGKMGSQMSDGVDLEVNPVDGLGHSRSASYASQHSRGSGYGSFSHSRQSSTGSEFSLGHTRTPSSVGSTLERRRVYCPAVPPHTVPVEDLKIEESGKEVVVGATRVDAEALVQELIESTDLNPTSVEEASGLQLLVQKDGTMALR